MSQQKSESSDESESAKTSGLVIAVQLAVRGALGFGWVCYDKMARMMVFTWRHAMSASVLSRSASSLFVAAWALRCLVKESESGSDMQFLYSSEQRK